MATVRPFKAVRPAKEYAEKVISLPYDVMNREEAAKMAEGNPYSFLHICRSEIDLPEQDNPYHPEVYLKAKENLEHFVEEGVFIEDKEPSLYIYKQVMDGRTQVGIVCTVSVDEYQDNTIKKHELTRVEKELDRIKHFDICNANTEPVFLTYRDDLRIRSLVEGYIASKTPEYDFISKDGIRHVLYLLDDQALIRSISGLFEEIDSLYIADGHHRCASSAKVSLSRRAEKPDYTGAEEFNYFMAVVFPDKDLKIFDYNRVIKDISGLSADDLIRKIEDAGFAVEKKGYSIYAPEKKHVFSMYLDGNWYKLTAGKAIIPEDAIGSLDVSILSDNILDPILDIKDQRTDERIDFVGGIRGLAELERRCSQDMKLAFAVYPVDIKDLLRVSDCGLVMPPKSTWFEPKLGSGLFIHRY